MDRRLLRERGYVVLQRVGAHVAEIEADSGIGLWHQCAGQGRFLCPAAGPIALAERDLCLHRATIAARFDSPLGHWQAVEVRFAEAFLADIARLELGRRRAPLDLARSRRLDDAPLAEMATVLARLARDGGADDTTLGALARALAARLLRRHLLGDGDAPRIDRRIARALQHIEANLDQPLRLDALAPLAGISMFHFSRLFAVEVGESVRAYVRRRRIEHAKKLLTTTSLPITEIAFCCGFAHQSHFTSVFRRATGRPPGSFRADATAAHSS